MSEWRSLERSPRDDGYRPDPPPGFPRAARPMEAASSAGEWAASSMCRRGSLKLLAERSEHQAASRSLPARIPRTAGCLNGVRSGAVRKIFGIGRASPTGLPFIARLMEAASSAGEWAASSMCRRGSLKLLAERSEHWAVSRSPPARIRRSARCLNGLRSRVLRRYSSMADLRRQSFLSSCV